MRCLDTKTPFHVLCGLFAPKKRKREAAIKLQRGNKPLLSYQSRLFFVTFLWLTSISDNPHNSFQHQNVKTRPDCFFEKNELRAFIESMRPPLSMAWPNMAMTNLKSDAVKIPVTTMQWERLRQCKKSTPRQIWNCRELISRCTRSVWNFFPNKFFSFRKHPSCWKVFKNYGFKYILSKGKVLKVILEKNDVRDYACKTFWGSHTLPWWWMRDTCWRLESPLFNQNPVLRCCVEDW